MKRWARAVLPAACAIALLCANASAADDPATRGEYLARASDCVACHTQPGGPPFAGSRPMATPFGTLYTSNITPDPEFGIGRWTADQFYRLMHEGYSPTLGLVYPAMPFAAYTKMTRADTDAILAYLKAVTPVHRRARRNELRFPFDVREMLLGWRTLYFDAGEFKPDPARTAEWNRGAYLVAGPGHCAMCHTRINALGGSATSEAFEGGLIPMQDWYAPSLTSNPENGLGEWSVAEIADLLQTGVSARGAVYGPMSEVVHNSLQYLTRDDVLAMAVYLKSLAPRRTRPAGKPVTSAAESSLLLRLGETVYAQQCAICHGAQGEGRPPDYPPLAGNPSIEMPSAVNPVRMVLNGGFPPVTKGNKRPFGMPPFAQTLSDDEVAAVVSFIRQAWGNHGQPVSAGQANALRKAPLD